VTEKWGVAPSQIGEVLALIGDSVDNIPGVPGIGPKTAVSLITEFGGLDALLARAESVSAKKARESLLASRELIAQNREMVRLDCDLPVPVPLGELVIRPRWTECVAAMERCEFKGLTAEVRADAVAAGAIVEASTQNSQPSAMSQGELF
jgi:DNA polymerase-1